MKVVTKDVGAERYRYERKFFVDQLSRAEVEHLVKIHPACFREIHHGRSINNIYLDSLDFRSYHDNVEGLEDRTKVRVRWYGDRSGVVDRPILEFKVKRGVVGRKDSFRLAPIKVGTPFEPGVVVESIRQSEMPGWARQRSLSLECKLLNRYRRRYFESGCRRYRITVDSELEFHPLNGSARGPREGAKALRAVVLEIKYARQDDCDADSISTHFPFLMSKMSKYVYGVDTFWGDPSAIW